MRQMILCAALLLTLQTQAQAGFWANLGQWLLEEPQALETTEGASVPVVLNEVHSVDGRCAECHLQYPPQDASLRPDADAFCAACHGQPDGGHPLGVVTQSSLPLLDGGRIGCVTCHDVKAGSQQNALRLPAAELCASCHGSADPSHAQLVGLAHGKREEARDRGQIDRFSQKCMSCHDGAQAPEAPVSLHGDPTYMLNYVGASIRGNHKIAGVYEEIAAGDREMASTHSLPASISLVEGKVGCLSCHDPYQSREKMLAVEIKGSRLCLTCHLK